MAILQAIGSRRHVLSTPTIAQRMRNEQAAKDRKIGDTSATIHVRFGIKTSKPVILHTAHIDAYRIATFDQLVRCKPGKPDRTLSVSGKRARTA